MDYSLIIPAFLAGLLTFLAPCTLPIVPGYLGFISGVSADDLQDPRQAHSLRRRIFVNGFYFIVGFSIIFIILGSLIGLAGAALTPFRVWLSRIGGLFVIFFGLMMLNIVRLPILSQEKHFNVPAMFKRGTPASSLLLGSAFAFGWTPCVGPVLAAILTLAATTTTVWQGALLLAVFAAGLAIPFLVIAAGIGSAAKAIGKITPYLRGFSIIGGLLLVLLGLLLLTNRFALMISWGYRALEFINYDRLLDYL